MPQATVCTDFDTHRLWVNQPCEREFLRHRRRFAPFAALRRAGSADIEVTGIPIHPVFAEPPSIAPACLARQGLVGDRPILLQLCGGFGVGPVEAVFHSLLCVDAPAEIVVVCGRNEELKEVLRKNASVAPSSRQDSRLYARNRRTHGVCGPGRLEAGRADDHRPWPAAADGHRQPDPRPGSRNSDYFLKNGAGIKVNHVCTLTARLSTCWPSPSDSSKVAGVGPGTRPSVRRPST